VGLDEDIKVSHGSNFSLMPSSDLKKSGDMINYNDKVMIIS
jgi:hypothetical protein